MENNESTLETVKQSVTARFEWKLKAFKKNGNLWLEWSTNAPFNNSKDKIEVYQNEWPSNPNSSAISWTYANQAVPWDTGLAWIPNLLCARITPSGPNEAYVYLEQLITAG
ncbi:hypothetical protein ACQY1Q_05000 [Tenacibaculum sp. TC6]|uniref:hypothetical protein n=1 Tax=Tenacibaculum sp. TC6 TaxID=3423223 RepID=UPI003D35EC87